MKKKIMKYKVVFLIVPIAVIILILPGYSTILAQSPVASTASAAPNTTSIISDYAKDVQDGEQANANDVDAQINQKGAKDNENTAGKEEGEDVETKEAIEPKEAVEPAEVENETENENRGEKSDSKSESGSNDVKSDSGSNKSVNLQQGSSNNSDKESKSGAGD